MADTILEKIEALVKGGYAKAYVPKHYALRLKKVSAPYSYDNEYGETHYDLPTGGAIIKGTRGEHWSPHWTYIIKKYLLADGSVIVPEALPVDVWIDIQTKPEAHERRKNVTWMIDPIVISSTPFKIGNLTIVPDVDMLCMNGDDKSPTTKWGFWPVKKHIAWGNDNIPATYEALA